MMLPDSDATGDQSGCKRRWNTEKTNDTEKKDLTNRTPEETNIQSNGDWRQNRTSPANKQEQPNK